MHEMLYTALQDYAADASAAIVYESHSYPYFFLDTDGDGEPGPGEAIYPNQYTGWTPRLLRAAYNYQYVAKDTGAFAHNPNYIVQVWASKLDDVLGNRSPEGRKPTPCRSGKLHTTDRH